MGGAVKVHTGFGLERRGASGIRVDHGWFTEPRCVLGGLGELRSEFAKGQELCTVADQSISGNVPKCRRPTVAEDYFVVVGEGEHVTQSGTHSTHLTLHRLLTV